MSRAKRVVETATSPLTAPVPLVIGITGHRDLRETDEEQLKDQLRAVFDDIRRRPDDQACGVDESKYLPLVLLSSLAEGADRLAAYVAEECGVKLVAVLPMPYKEYIKTFPESVDQFNNLLKEAKRTIIIPWADLNGELKEDDRQALQYLVAGVYVARHSRYLIALWDGVDTHKMGGTSDVVAYRRTGRLNLDERLNALVTRMPPPYGLHRNQLDPPETGPLYHIPTPRKSSAALQGAPPQVGEAELLAPEGYDDPYRRDTYFKRLREINHRIATFNEDALKLVPDLWDEVERNRSYLFPDKQTARLPASLRSLRQTYAMVDTLALHFQRLTYDSLHMISLIIFIVVLIFGCYAHLLHDPHHLWPLTFYLVLLALADLYHQTVRRRDYQNKFQDYRALAEGLRVQFYWKLAGLRDSVSDHYFRKQKSELAWIPNAIQACSLLAKPAHIHLWAVHKRWINDQYKYFRRTAKSDHLKSIRYKERGNGLLLVSLLLALYEIIYHPSNWLMIVLAVGVVGVGCRHFLNKRKEVKEEASRAGDFAIPSAAHHATKKVSRESWKNFVFGVLIGAAIVGALLGAQFFVIHPEALGFLLVLKMPDWLVNLDGLASLLKEETHDWLVVAMELTALAAALSHDYVNKRAFTEHHKQYLRMEDLFRYAKQQFNQTAQSNRPDDVTKLVRELGREALAEHGDWVLLHRERPLELPKAEI